jgi:hypothetical protein
MPNFPSDIDSDFARLKADMYEEGEEIRYDIPATLAGGAVYVGAAPAGSGTGETVWDVVKTDFDSNGNPSRDRFARDIAWDNRTTVSF